ncbi:ferritin-like domain-containing protein [Miniphocaeibacter halophilus]|uniref:Uncharacterized protein n=1 Tax=Miniphocaeibacter halophilus TaxID=2931922 RepID=A0AC61MNQ5_9FIRM|nr:ferritin-like domain-containing protein [Miniphocaeibacter halophilus]QQK07167.1 hypothetical protein JFY71_07495 [Miniphocaeibacter halophilus]
MDKNVLDNANELINYNLNNYLYYRSMKSWTDRNGWKGFSNLLNKQSMYALKDSEIIENYLRQLGYVVSFEKMDKIENGIENLQDVIKAVVKTEKKLCNKYDEIVLKAREEKNYEIEIFFKNLLANQTKVVSYIEPLELRMKRIGKKSNGLFILNSSLAKL